MGMAQLLEQRLAEAGKIYVTISQNEVSPLFLSTVGRYRFLEQYFADFLNTLLLHRC